MIINVTSLIDVMFILVLFFTVSTTFISQPAMNLQLPTAEHAEATRQTPIIVHIDEKGTVYLNDEPVETALLSSALTARLATSTEKAVVLKADSRVSHGDVIQVLDIIKGAGVQKYSCLTSAIW